MYPPSKAPNILLKPPTILEANIETIMSAPVAGTISCLKGSRHPAIPAKAPDRNQEKSLVYSTFIPIISAKAGFSIEALKAIPNFVLYNKNSSPAKVRAITSVDTKNIADIPAMSKSK